MAKSSELRLELVQEVPHEEGERSTRLRRSSFWQCVRFAVVGVVNTGIDLLVLNILLFCFPTQNVLGLLFLNAIAYSVGAINSFFLNKYWTFEKSRSTTRQEFFSFIVVNSFGIGCNSLLLSLIAGSAHPTFFSTVVWANIAKVCAISGTATLSFLGMRLWVFAGGSEARKSKSRGESSV